MPEVISSAANPVAKRIRLLAERKHRRQQGVFVVEGIQPVWRAVEAGWQIETLVIAPELLTGSAAAMVAEQEAAGLHVARLSTELFARLSEREGPSGLAAIVATRAPQLAGLTPGPGAVYAVLHRVANPGNLGTIIRTADAIGAAGVILLADGTDPYAPAAVKASMGSLFAVDVVSGVTPEAFLDWAAAGGVQVVAASGTADRHHWDVAYQPPLAILLGSEREGLPLSLLEAASLRVRIPMTGTAESLNLAVAAGIMLYEARRHLVCS